MQSSLSTASFCTHMDKMAEKSLKSYSTYLVRKLRGIAFCGYVYTRNTYIV